MSARRAVGGILLAALYMAAFFVLTHPRGWLIATHVWADLGDGLNGFWGLWWFQTALVELHQSPFHTTYVHYPFGLSLHMHALCSWNALVALLLGTVLEPIATHNAVVLSTFVLSGLTAFALARAVVGSTTASIFAGYLFAFSSYHFAHAGAHMNLITMQWIPLFLLLWIRLLASPSHRTAIAAALALTGVYISDYYYFAYCLLAGLVFALAEARRRRAWAFAAGPAHRGALVVFAAVFCMTSGPLIIGLLQTLWGETWMGGHDPRHVSLDLLAPFVPGEHSHFAGLGSWYWQRAPRSPNEVSVFVGLSTLALAAAARGLRTWRIVFALFGLLALGPRLHVLGTEVPGLLLPYGWLEPIVPGMQMTGVPARAFVMTSLALALLAGAGMQRLAERGGRGRWLAAALVGLAIVETLPGPMPASPLPEAAFATHLHALPDRDPLIDLTSPPLLPGVRLYLQTIHERPMAYGYTSRTPRRLRKAFVELQALGSEQHYRELQCAYGFRWVLTDDTPLEPGAIRTSSWPADRAVILHDLERRFGSCPSDGQPPDQRPSAGGT